MALATAPGREIAMNSVSQRELRAVVIFVLASFSFSASLFAWEALVVNGHGSGEIVIVSLLEW
jgi:hypothetical protein